MTSRKLIEAVEAGNEAAAKLEARRLYPACAPDMGRAFNGSLDAAKALHDALLPGWRVVDVSELNGYGLKGQWFVELASWTEERSVSARADSEHRARLIAILRALEDDQ